MKTKLSFSYSLDFLVALAAVGGALTVLQTFIIGEHYIIPTITVVNTLLLSHLAYFGYQDKVWAKHILFWFAIVICCHTFFALFWAQSERQYLGGAFTPIYGAVCVVAGFLAVKYAKANRLFDGKFTFFGGAPK